MGHIISGIVGATSVLRSFASDRKLHSPTILTDALSFLPLSDSHLDQLFPSQGEFDPNMVYLSESLKETLKMLSVNSAIAYIETEYFGGTGTQGAAVFNEGASVFGPVSSNISNDRDIHPISDALRLLGVVKTKGQDEFDTAGLGRFRCNDDWIEAS